MTEYWKSLPRKFCIYCKCWITDNKSSVEFHERGKNHLENVKKKIDELRKKGLKDAKEKESADSVLKAMEVAALKSAREDLKRDPSLAALYGATIVAKASEAAAATQLAPTQTTRAQSQAGAGGGGPGKAPSAKTSAGTYGGERHRPAPVAAAVGRNDAGPVCLPGGGGGMSDSPGAAVGDSDDAGGGGDGVDDAGGGSAVVDDAVPTAAEWQRALSPEGYEYYWNVRTGESSWTLPEGAAAAAAEIADGAASEEATAEGDEQQQRQSAGASLAEHTSLAAARTESAVEGCGLAAAASAACVPAVTMVASGADGDGEPVKVKAEPSNAGATAATCITLEAVADDVVKAEPSRASSLAKAAIAAAAERLKAEARTAAGTIVKSEAGATAPGQIKVEPGDDGCAPVTEATCDAAAAALVTAAAKGSSAAERTGAGSGHRRPAISFSPYGRWVTVEAEKPPPVVDLQLPTNAKNYDVPVLDIPLPERVNTLAPAKDVQPQFKEKVVTLQGKVAGEVAFKKRKVGGAKQNARRRDGEDE